MNLLNQERTVLLSESDTGSIRVSYDVIKFIIMQVALDTPGSQKKKLILLQNF